MGENPKTVQNPIHLLSVDLEEWFHILEYFSNNSLEHWNSFESRIHESTEQLLVLFENKQVKATFFSLGWIAQKYPDLIERIAKTGHEIGCHSSEHSLVHTMTPNQFEKDIAKALDRLRSLSGQPVTAFRAPGFSITKKCLWAFDILARNGITVDSSVFPATRAHGGMPGAPDKPFIIETFSGCIKELPISTFKWFRKRMAFSGGGYLRLFPYCIHETLFNHAIRRNKSIILYLHPRDIDKGQPKFKLPPLRLLKSYINIRTTYKKTERMLHRYTFGCIGDVVNYIDWDSAEKLNLDSLKKRLIG